MAACVVLVNVAIAGLLATMVWQVLSASLRSYEHQARDVSTGLASVAKLNVESEIGRIDAILRSTGGEIERLLCAGSAVPDQLLNDVLQARFDLVADIEAFRLADRDGNVRWGTELASGTAVQVADRDYFQQARSQGDATVVAGPLQSRVSGNWVIAFVRPLRVNDQFGGILYISVNVRHFGEVFKHYALEPLDAVTLRRADHRLVARHSPGSSVQGRVGDTHISVEQKQRLAADARQGSFTSRVTIDGELRTTAYRALDPWPFVVFAGVSKERFLAPWRQQAWVVCSLAVLAWLLGAIATWSVFQADGRKAAALKTLAEQNQLIKALLRVSADGIHIVDKRGVLIEMSESFADMLKSSRERLLGRHIASWDAAQGEADIARWLAGTKPGDRQRLDVQHRRDDGELIDVELNMSVTEIAGEKLVFASGRDVTQIRRLLREQAAMLDTDLVGIVRIADRKITWHNRAVERIFGYGPGELDGLPMMALYPDEAAYESLGRALYPALAEHAQYRSLVRMRCKNGHPVWIDFGAARLSDTEIFVMAIDVSALKEAHDVLSHAAFHDALTQLPNRALLYDRIEQALAVAVREQRDIAIGYLDLDGFKAVNDDHGHDAGDQLLQAIARRLARGVRPGDTVARIGGDEFVVLLTSVQDGDWRGVLQRLITSVKQPIPLQSGAVVCVGATAGVAVASPSSHATAFELIERADHAMLRGKRENKGAVFSV